MSDLKFLETPELDLADFSVYVEGDDWCIASVVAKPSGGVTLVDDALKGEIISSISQQLRDDGLPYFGGPLIGKSWGDRLTVLKCGNDLCDKYHFASMVGRRTVGGILKTDVGGVVKFFMRNGNLGLSFAPSECELPYLDQVSMNFVLQDMISDALKVLGDKGSNYVHEVRIGKGRLHERVSATNRDAVLNARKVDNFRISSGAINIFINNSPLTEDFVGDQYVLHVHDTDSEEFLKLDVNDPKHVKVLGYINNLIHLYDIPYYGGSIVGDDIIALSDDDGSVKIVSPNINEYVMCLEGEDGAIGINALSGEYSLVRDGARIRLSYLELLSLAMTGIMEMSVFLGNVGRNDTTSPSSSARLQ